MSKLPFSSVFKSDRLQGLMPELTGVELSAPVSSLVRRLAGPIDRGEERIGSHITAVGTRGENFVAATDRCDVVAEVRNDVTRSGFPVGGRGAYLNRRFKSRSTVSRLGPVRIHQRRAGLLVVVDHIHVTAVLDADNREELRVQSAGNKRRHAPRSTLIVGIPDIDIGVLIRNEPVGRDAACGDPAVLIRYVDAATPRAILGDSDTRVVVGHTSVIPKRRGKCLRADLRDQYWRPPSSTKVGRFCHSDLGRNRRLPATLPRHIYSAVRTHRWLGALIDDGRFARLDDAASEGDTAIGGTIGLDLAVKKWVGEIGYCNV